MGRRHQGGGAGRGPAPALLSFTGHRPPARWPRGVYAVADDPGALHEEPVTGLGRGDVGAYARWASKDAPTAALWDRAAQG